jgi:hypothetical protein
VSAPLKKIFNDILKGYSVVTHSSQTFYVKHLNNLDLSIIDNSHNIYLEDTKLKGVPTQEEKLEYLIKNDLWNKKDENKIKEFKNLAARYEENKSNEFLKSKRDIWDKQLKDLNKDIQDLEIKKNNLLGDTAESFAYKKSNILHIQESFYKDPELKIKYFSDEDLDEKIDAAELNNIYDLFVKYLNDFNSDNLKRIALSSFFMNMFNLTESIYEFYGKPIIYLSFYQIDVVSWGKYFQNVLREMKTKLPNNILNDPDKIIEYVELNKNYDKINEGKEAESGAVPGATRTDLEILGMKPEAGDRLSKKLKEKGSLNADELFSMM